MSLEQQTKQSQRTVRQNKCPNAQRIRGFFFKKNEMRYINPRFTYFTYLKRKTHKKNDYLTHQNQNNTE